MGSDHVLTYSSNGLAIRCREAVRSSRARRVLRSVRTRAVFRVSRLQWILYPPTEDGAPCDADDPASQPHSSTSLRCAAPLAPRWVFILQSFTESLQSLQMPVSPLPLNPDFRFSASEYYPPLRGRPLVVVRFWANRPEPVVFVNRAYSI